MFQRQLSQRVDRKIESQEDQNNEIQDNEIRINSGGFALLGIAAFGENEGKAQFGDIPTDHYVVTQEVDSVFTSWTNGQDIAFNNSSPDKFKIGDQTLGQILDGKIDATNGVAYVDFKVYPTNETISLSHLILTHESMSIGNTSWVEYKQDGITYNDETYKFNDTTNGIVRKKDLDAYVRLEDLQDGITFDTMNVTNLTVDGKQVLTGEDDPAFKEVFTNSTLNLIAYDGINLVGTNSVKITSQQLDIKGEVAINGDVYVKGVGGYEGAETEGMVDLATAINEALNAGTTIGEIQDAAAEAQQEIEDANDIEGIKSALIKFFNAIK